MAAVIHLATVVDIDEGPAALHAPMGNGLARAGGEPGLAPTSSPSNSDPGSMSVSAVHLAVLHGGRRLTLLDDRGWAVSGPPDIWHRTSAAEIEATARMVVGPDEPFSGHSLADMEADHWVDLAGALRRQGVSISAEELCRLPHGVELTERLHARLLDT